MSRWVGEINQKFVPERDPVHSSRAKRAHTLGNTFDMPLLVVISFIAILMILGELGIQTESFLGHCRHRGLGHWVRSVELSQGCD